MALVPKQMLCYVSCVSLRARAGRLGLLDMGDLGCGGFMSREEIEGDLVHRGRAGIDCRTAMENACLLSMLLLPDAEEGGRVEDEEEVNVEHAGQSRALRSHGARTATSRDDGTSLSAKDMGACVCI
jgi:hypothetical protein